VQNIWPRERTTGTRTTATPLSVEEEYELALAIEVGALAGDRAQGPSAAGLPADALRDLGLLQRVGETALRRFLEANLGLVGMVAAAHHTDRAAFDDLFQDGYFGLVRAIKGFDARRGTRFSTYAVPWIRKSILESTARHGVIKVPDYAKRRALTPVTVGRSAIERATDEAALVSCTSLDQTMPTIAASAADGMDEHLWNLDVKGHIDRAMAALDQRHREVVSGYFGLGRDEPRSMEEVASWLGLSRSTVSRALSTALARMRERADLRSLLAASSDL
jgi:RNA polymerase sigma factor (sigma-70 family)